MKKLLFIFVFLLVVAPIIGQTRVDYLQLKGPATLSELQSITTTKTVTVTSVIQVASTATITRDIHVVGGGGFTVDAGATLYFTGSFSAENNPVFFGDGSVEIRTSAIDKINVRWFGAAGDNSTDDTEAIQKAFNAIRYAGNSSQFPLWCNAVYFPGGTYLISKCLQVPESIIVEGSGVTTLLGTTIKQTAATDTLDLYGLKNPTRNRAADQQITGIRFTNVSTGGGIRALSSDYPSDTCNIGSPVIKNCWFLNSSGGTSAYSIIMDAAEEISGCGFDSTSGGHIQIGTCNRLINNTFYSSALPAITVAQQNINSNPCIITANWFYDCGSAAGPQTILIATSTSALDISNNSFTRCYGSIVGANVSVASSTVANNKFYGLSDTAIEGVSWAYCNINNNLFAETNIDIAGPSFSGYLYYCNFSGNTFTSSTATPTAILAADYSILSNNMTRYPGGFDFSAVDSAFQVDNFLSLNCGPTFEQPPFAASQATLLNSWVAYDGNTQVVTYWKTAETVHISGSIKGGTIAAGTDIFELEAGFRPQATVIAACGYAASGAYNAGSVAIGANGVVELREAITTSERLDLNISFQTAK